MSTRAFSVTVRATDSTPLVGASVCVNTICGTTAENGRVRIEGISTDWHQVQLAAGLQGYASYSASVNLDPGGPPFVDVDWPDLYLEPEAVAAQLHIEGMQFRRDDGSPWIWKGATDFLLYEKFLDGQDIQPILAERVSLGANLVRVLGMCHNISHFYPKECPGYYERLGEFAARLASQGLYLEFVIFADQQHVKAPEHPHFQRVCDGLRGAPNVFVELCNEWPKNGITPTKFTKPAGLLSSQGSALSDAPPPRPGWDYHTWHGRRDWPKVTSSFEDAWYTGAGTGSIKGPPKPIVHDEPMGFDERPQPGRRSTNPDLARQLAITAIVLGAGATYHSEAGLTSVSMGPIQQQCARAFFGALDA